MKRHTLFWLFVAALLAGCATGLRNTPPVNTKGIHPTVRVPQGLSTAVRTLVPAATPGYPVPSSNSYPPPPTASGTAGPANPYPAPHVLIGPTANTIISATGAPAAPFHDCARTPGLLGCDPNAVALKARLAYLDTSPSRVVGLDLETGQGWQVPSAAGAQAWLDWSQETKQPAHLLEAQGDNRYQVFSADGRLLETFNTEAIPAWQPDGPLSANGSIHSQQGDQASLEHTRDMRWLLHVKTAQGEKSLELNSDPGDILYKLLSWAPGGGGASKLLAQAYFASNEAMTQGGQVISIDAATGAITRYPASMPLSDLPAADFAWDPLQPGRLALLESSETSVLAPRLALLDLNTGQVTFPLPESLVIDSIAWHPDGRLAICVAGPTGPNSSGAQQDLPGVGIYWLNMANGKTQPLVSTPPGATDGWLHFTADGKYLIYARAISAVAKTTVEVRLRQLSDGKEWVLAEGIPVPATNDPTSRFGHQLAISLK